VERCTCILNAGKKVRRENLESAASANFAELPGWQGGTGKRVLAKLLDALSPWRWEEKQLLCSVVEVILKAEGRGSQKTTLNLGGCLERREQIRFGIHAVVDFEWLDGEGVRQQGQGLTRDISSKGLFIYSDFQPPAKADLQVEVFFDSVTGANTNLQLRIKALLLRGEPATRQGERHGFALLNRSCKVCGGVTPIEN
jgi:hypothetical protein